MICRLELMRIRNRDARRGKSRRRADSIDGSLRVLYGCLKASLPHGRVRWRSTRGAEVERPLRPRRHGVSSSVMPAISTNAVPAFLSRLSSRLVASPAAPPSSTFLLPLVAATTLGHGKTWLRSCVDLAFANCPPRPSAVPYEPPHPLEDATLHPRRFAVAQMKEALVKSAILIGVPKAIETLLELGDVVEEEDMSKAFVRSELSLPEQTVSERWVNGQDGLRSVYQDQLDDIFTLMAKLGLEDLGAFGLIPAHPPTTDDSP